MAKKVEIAKPPELFGVPRVDFWNPDFDVLIWNKGYNVMLEKAIPCPCSRKVNYPQSACQNCLGTGWIYTNPVNTKAVIQSINKSTKYKDWSQELVGTVSVTIENRFQLSFRDRLTIIDSVSTDSEVQLVRKFEDHLFLYTIYPIKEIDFIFKYEGNEIPLKKLSQYTVEENIIHFEDGVIQEGDSISIRYKHNLQYVIVDINHDIRNSYLLDHSSREEQNKLPVSAIAKKLHYIHDNVSINGPTVIDNDGS